MSTPRQNTYRSMLRDTVEAIAQVEASLLPNDDRARVLQARITHIQERLNVGGSEAEFYDTLLYALGDMKLVGEQLPPLSIARTTLQIQIEAVEGVLTDDEGRGQKS
ncbi:hypothetical protein HOT99_gp242 [Caulobacter phage CcrBL10]|uniref:Uncharacterized protein n=1 Tax=Caulobacter phage CcrBL10 TaxID=2283269 RepID=A0A385EBL5_9CAUD|nr:hypothetical protein HOT99_gp242 [Caulobacter phage CcrBL10]AXQ68375.1 hypothetical protein CcrBL10_gp171c [Caulobacter phage CcrBL10]